MFRIAFLGIDHPHGAGWRDSVLNLGDDATITAIMPGFGGGTASLEERNSQAPRFATVEELIAHAEFDGAIVCLPNDEGPMAVETLARAGKHVLAEKPMAASVSSAEAALEAVRKAGVAFQAGYMWRYDEATNRLAEMLRDGRFGKLISVEMTMATSDVNRRGPGHYLFDKSRSGGGFFNWLACHYLDLLAYVVGAPVVAVTARVGTFGVTPIDVDDGGTAILELADGAIATFTGGYWLPRWTGESRWTLRGSHRWVHWHPTKPGTGGVLEIHGPQPQFQPMDETFALPEDHTSGYGGAKSVHLLRDWIDSARTGRPCRNTPESVRQTLRVLDAVYQSSAEGRRVTL